MSFIAILTGVPVRFISQSLFALLNAGTVIEPPRAFTTILLDIVQWQWGQRCRLGRLFPNTWTFNSLPCFSMQSIISTFPVNRFCVDIILRLLSVYDATPELYGLGPPMRKKNEDKYIFAPVHFEKIDQISIKKLIVALLNLEKPLHVTASTKHCSGETILMTQL